MEDSLVLTQMSPEQPASRLLWQFLPVEANDLQSQPTPQPASSASLLALDSEPAVFVRLHASGNADILVALDEPAARWMNQQETDQGKALLFVETVGLRCG